MGRMHGRGKLFLPLLCLIREPHQAGSRSLLKMLRKTFASLQRRARPHLRLVSFFVILIALLGLRALLEARSCVSSRLTVLPLKLLKIYATLSRRLLPSASIWRNREDMIPPEFEERVSIEALFYGAEHLNSGF